MVHKILSINEISTSIQGHTSVENEQKNIVQSSKSTSCQYHKHEQNLIEIHKLIEHEHNSDVDQGP